MFARVGMELFMVFSGQGEHHNFALLLWDDIAILGNFLCKLRSMQIEFIGIDIQFTESVLGNLVTKFGEEVNVISSLKGTPSLFIFLVLVGSDVLGLVSC